jgi:hypothetical protein
MTYEAGNDVTHTVRSFGPVLKTSWTTLELISVPLSAHQSTTGCVLNPTVNRPPLRCICSVEHWPDVEDDGQEWFKSWTRK